jgi:hypothetical protein
MRQDTPEGKDFCQKVPNIRIMPPTDFLRELSAIQQSGGP